MKRIKTPGSYGPWRFQGSESGETIWIGNDSENAGCVPGFTDHPHNIGNARLMAAAPIMLDALRNVQKLISEAAMTGFNCKDGDWAERLFQSQQMTSDALKAATGSHRGDC